MRAGSNISPLEVEQILLQHCDVRDAAVIGIPDATLGQRVIAFIELKADATAESLAAIQTRLEVNWRIINCRNGWCR